MTHPESPSSPASSSRASTPLRALSAAAGVLALLLSAVLTFGAALAAPLGVLAARRVARRKGRPLTRGASWLGAVLASSSATALLIVMLLALAPAGTLNQMRAAMDSARTQEAEPPEWVTRVSPQAAQPNPAVERLVNSRPFTIYFGLLGLAFACALWGAVAGSAGWAGTLLVGYGIMGRWPVRRAATDASSV